MKSLLLILTPGSFTIYKAGQNKKIGATKGKEETVSAVVMDAKKQ